MKKIFILITALISVSLTACSDVKENPDNISGNLSLTSSDKATLNEQNISDSDIEKVRQSLAQNEQYVYDTEITDLDCNGQNELLVLESYAANRRFSLWEKSNGEMTLAEVFGEGKVRWIDEISLYKKQIDGENVYLFGFSYSGENSMEAEVLSALKKTADGYEVEHLLSHGTISYETAEPFTKEFYRIGWSKYDIGEGDFGDIAKEEYDRLYEMYTQNIPDLQQTR